MGNKTVYICKMTVSNGKQVYRAGDQISLDPDAAKQLLAARAIEIAGDQIVVEGADSDSALADARKTILMLEDAGKALQAEIDRLNSERSDIDVEMTKTLGALSLLEKAGKTLTDENVRLVAVLEKKTAEIATLKSKAKDK